MTAGDNTNSGQQAAGNITNGGIHNYYYDGGPPAPKESERHVKSETKARIQFRDPGTFISYTVPDSHDELGERFWGKFYRNWEEVTDVKDLPRCLTKLWLFDGGLGGDLAQLPRALKNLSLGASKKITGNVAALPQTLQHLGLHQIEKITGDLYALPKGLVHLNLLAAYKVTGNIWELPRNLQFVNLQNNRKIHGKIQHLPKGLTKAFFYFADLDGRGLGFLEGGLGFFATVIGAFSNSSNFAKKCEGFSRQYPRRGFFCDGPRGIFCDSIHSGKKIWGSAFL